MHKKRTRDLFKGVRFSKNSTIYLHGCRTGYGTKGKNFYKFLRKLTGAKIKGWDKSTYPDQWNHFSGALNGLEPKEF